MASIAVLEKLSKAKNPKIGLVTEVGDVSKVALMGNRVLVAIYIAPEKTKSGLYRAPSTIKEDVFQGVVGLVLKKGHVAFKDDPAAKVHFHGEDVKLHDWVVFRPGDARRVQINGVDCRLIEDTLLDMVIDDPELITHR